MLVRLDKEVKGNKWHNLFDKVYRLPVLEEAFAHVKARDGATGVDHVTVQHFENHLEANLNMLHGALQDGSCRPQPIRRHYILKPGSSEQRPLGIPAVRDRVVQTALRMVIDRYSRRSCSPQLRLPPQAGLQGSAAAGGRAFEGRLCPKRRNHIFRRGRLCPATSAQHFAQADGPV